MHNNNICNYLQITTKLVEPTEYRVTKFTRKRCILLILINILCKIF